MAVADRRHARMRTVAYPNFRWTLRANRLVEAYPKMLEHVGHHTMKRRFNMGLNRKEAARRLGVHPRGLENWEYGRTTPADRFMPAVIRFLGYNPLPAPQSRGERVAYERVVRGWSRKRLAAEAAVDEATVRRIEADTAGLALKSLQRVLETLEMENTE